MAYPSRFNHAICLFSPRLLSSLRATHYLQMPRLKAILHSVLKPFLVFCPLEDYGICLNILQVKLLLVNILVNIQIYPVFVLCRPQWIILLFHIQYTVFTCNTCDAYSYINPRSIIYQFCI